MEDKKIDIIKINDRVYLLDEAHESTGYLCIGERRACLIDTMNGYNDLKKVCASITELPVTVVNTHGHPDHIMGNMFFDNAYLNEKDWDLAKSFIEEAECVELQKKLGRSFPEFTNISEGDVIDLGGITLKIYELAGHTAGGILVLCPELRILFTGDSINHHLWMQLDGCTTIHELADNLEEVMFLEKEADYILHGHARSVDDISLIRCLYDGAKDLAARNTENDKTYNWFGGVDMQHPFEVLDGKIYSMPESVICYRKDNI